MTNLTTKEKFIVSIIGNVLFVFLYLANPKTEVFLFVVGAQIVWSLFVFLTGNLLKKFKESI
jgi:hypothetical protein